MRRLADCIEESDRVLTMLNTLMDITEAEHGMMRLHRERRSVSQLMENVLEVYRLVAEEKKIEITAHCDDPCYADVDPNRIQQALANLLDNAVKYTREQGRISIAMLVVGSTPYRSGSRTMESASLSQNNRGSGSACTGATRAGDNAVSVWD